MQQSPEKWPNHDENNPFTYFLDLWLLMCSKSFWKFCEARQNQAFNKNGLKVFCFSFFLKKKVILKSDWLVIMS